MATRDELITALSERYNGSDRDAKGRILDEFVAVTGYHRKHAMRVLRVGRPDPAERSARRGVYDQAASEAIVALWEASDRVCGKRLKALIPMLVDALERHGHLRLEAAVREAVLAMSAATIDRRLRPIRARSGQKRRSQSWACLACASRSRSAR